ncbi:MAG: vacuolar sorting protein VPS33/slp1 [Geoglossum umbratile]|nr:MAG: vacuolar sorting protein VPS33/slp1 [Geoglossum umbratile]
MGISVINVQRDIILDAVRNTARGEWKVLVIDEATKKLIDNVVKEDDILNENVTNIEQIEHRRPVNKDMDAVYILSPLPHIVDCLMADFQRRRYRKSHLVWTALLEAPERRRIDSSQSAREQIGEFKTLSVDFFPRESHLITFRDPWSFPVLFHPACNHLVRGHMHELTKKIVSICISLGEYPSIRYYRPKNPSHEASVLSTHLARFVQEELDAYAQYHEDFPAPSNRPRGALFITDRSMDLYSPLIHEFTYQAMAHDLLPIKEGDKVLYKTVIKQGEPDEEEKEMEIGEKDKIWVENRHRHMKDTIEKLMEDFQKFIDENPHFTNTSADANSLNAIKDMLAGLPQFQELKESYSLHLNMAQECMNIFQKHKLPDIASVEQTLATGLDEDYRKPKNLADDLVRLLDDENVAPTDRLRLILLYTLYRDGLLQGDTLKLLAHAQLPPQDEEIIQNLELLGARVHKPLKDSKPPPQPLFGKKQAPTTATEEYALSRFEPSLKLMLECHVKGTLDQSVFPFTKPQLDAPDGASGLDNQSQASLRSAKPTWARGRLSSIEPRQRIIIFMAGGATYAEARSCYEISKSSSRDVFLATSHMVTPSLFLRQVSDLSADKRRLDIPAERPKPRAPQHLFEPEPAPKPTAQAAPPPRPKVPPTAAMASMTLSPGRTPSNGGKGSGPPPVPKKQDKKDKKDEKKKRHFFSHKKE